MGKAGQLYPPLGLTQVRKLMVVWSTACPTFQVEVKLYPAVLLHQDVTLPSTLPFRSYDILSYKCQNSNSNWHKQK